MTMFARSEASQKIYERLIEECVNRRNDVFMPIDGHIMADDFEIFLFQRLAENDAAIDRAHAAGRLPKDDEVDGLKEAFVIREILNGINRYQRPWRLRKARPNWPRDRRKWPDRNLGSPLPSLPRSRWPKQPK